jgi:hypothetical protein
MFIGALVQPNQKIGVNVYYENVGTGTAVGVAGLADTSIQDDDSLASQRSAVEHFEKWKLSQDHSRSDIAKGHKSYITGYGPVLSPTDADNIILGRRTMITVAEIPFFDDFGSHVQLLCLYPKPGNSPIVWVRCREHNEER